MNVKNLTFDQARHRIDNENTHFGSGQLKLDLHVLLLLTFCCKNEKLRSILG